MSNPVEGAARNNAEWCATVCRAHGVEGRFDPAHWVSATRTPPRYPDAITLTPDAPVTALLGSIDRSSGCSS